MEYCVKTICRIKIKPQSKSMLAASMMNMKPDLQKQVGLFCFWILILVLGLSLAQNPNGFNGLRPTIKALADQALAKTFAVQ
jgi:hypothetical protein